jgi:hypothetical protein
MEGPAVPLKPQANAVACNSSAAIQSQMKTLPSPCPTCGVPSWQQPLSKPSIQVINARLRQPFKLCHPVYSGFPPTLLSSTTTYADFFKESRMRSTGATTLDRKSGEAEGSAVLLNPKPTLLLAILQPHPLQVCRHCTSALFEVGL